MDRLPFRRFHVHAAYSEEEQEMKIGRYLRSQPARKSAGAVYFNHIIMKQRCQAAPVHKQLELSKANMKSQAE